MTTSEVAPHLSHQYWRTDFIYSLLVQLAAHQASLFVSEHGLTNFWSQPQVDVKGTAVCGFAVY